MFSCKVLSGNCAIRSYTRDIVQPSKRPLEFRIGSRRCLPFRQTLKKCERLACRTTAPVNAGRTDVAITNSSIMDAGKPSSPILILVNLPIASVALDHLIMAHRYAHDLVQLDIQSSFQ